MLSELVGSNVECSKLGASIVKDKVRTRSINVGVDASVLEMPKLTDKDHLDFALSLKPRLQSVLDLIVC